MKKLIMFLMVLAIGVPALATIEDVSPPDWGGTTPSANVVWQIDTAHGVPTCTVYDPPLAGDPEIIFGTYEEEEIETWDSVAGNFVLEDDEYYTVLVEVPGGTGANLTVHVQIAYEGEPIFTEDETSLELWSTDEGMKDTFMGEISPSTNVNVGSGVWVQQGTFTADNVDEPEEYANAGNVIGILNGGTFTITGIIIDVIRHDGAAPSSGPSRRTCENLYGPMSPIAIDPNVMLVYETGETVGDFDVSLNFPPVGQGGPGSPQGTPYEVTVLIDPNGINGGYGKGTPGEKDIVLLDGAGADNTITLTFNTSNWDIPQTILFQALDDPCAEPPSLIEITNVSVTVTSTVAEPNLNGPLDSELNPWEAGDPKWTRDAAASVKDNDQATILSVKEDGETEQVDPLTLMEEPLAFDWFGEPTYKEQTVRIVLQVEPRNDADPCTPLDAYVRVTMENEAEDNPPFADPCLVPGSANSPSEPNAIVFTVDGASVPGVVGDFQKWDVPYTIVIMADNDNELQVEPGESEGDENYETALVFFVESTTDARYGESEQQYDDQGEPIPDQFEWVALETSVPIDIQDNECGAFGIFPLDISNPYYLTDPNWVDEETGNPLPDCHVDIWDFLRIVSSWLDCDDPHDPIGCAPFPDPVVEE